LSRAVAQATAANSGSSRAAPRAAVRPGRRARGAGGGQAAARLRELAQDPSFREAYTTLANADTNALCRPIFKALNLSPAQIEAFDELAAEAAPDSPLRPESETRA